MIVKVFNNLTDLHPQRYSFPTGEVTLGRNPTPEQSVLVDSPTISRNHLSLRVTQAGRVQLIDLGSSNGTFKGEMEYEEVEKKVWVGVEEGERIRLAQFEGYITVQLREDEVKRSSLNIVRRKPSSEQQQSDSTSSRQRSRQKGRPSQSLPFAISSSTLKMLKQMTLSKKSKAQRIKFLKLMGIGKAEQYWGEIEQMVSRGKSSLNEGRRAVEDLQRQFSQSRNSFEKKGLGRV